MDRLGCRWWWTSWGPWREFIFGWLAFTDGYPPEDSFWVDQDLGAELERWRCGEFLYLTGPFQLKWLNAAESLRVARDVFDVNGWIRGQADWCDIHDPDADPGEPLTV